MTTQSKRYAHKRLTFRAWDTVVRELIELRERMIDGSNGSDESSWVNENAMKRIQETIENLRIVWSNRAEEKTAEPGDYCDDTREGGVSL